MGETKLLEGSWLEPKGATAGVSVGTAEGETETTEGTTLEITEIGEVIAIDGMVEVLLANEGAVGKKVGTSVDDI